MKWPCSLKLISLYFFISITSLLQADIRNLDGLWKIVPPEYKKYSLIHGAILWETGWVNNFYRFANYYPIEALDRRGREIISYDPEKTDAVTQLVYTLFYRVPGSQSFTDFSTTDLIKPTSAKEVAHLIAEILVALPNVKKVVEQGQQNSRLLRTLLEPEDIQNNPHIQSLKNEFGKIKESGSLDKFTHEAKKLFKSAKSPLDPAVITILKEGFDQYFNNLEQLEKLTLPLNNLLKLSKTSNLKMTPQELVALTYQALNECENDPNTYDSELVYSLWLAFLYKTVQKLVKNDSALERAAFCEYYKKLSELLKVPMVLPEQSSLTATIDYEKAAQAFSSMIKDSDKNPPALDDLLLYAVESKPLPPLEGYATTYFVDKNNKKTPSFPDCMENSIANFIRILSYDRHLGTYSLNNLEHNLGISLSQSAKDRLTPFFKNVFDHQAWAQLVEDIDYVPYLQNTDNVLARCSIKIRNSQKLQPFEDAGYTIIKDIAYELRPSLRTIIIILNQVLDLNLFDEEKEQEETSPFLRKDFVGHYFPKLCKKLKVEGYYSLTPDNDDLTKEIDTVDFEGNQKIYIVFKSSFGGMNVKHQFVTTQRHGEYYCKLLGAEQNNAEYDNLKGGSFKENLILFNLLGIKISDDILSYKNIFAGSLYNPDVAYTVAEKVKNTYIGSSTLTRNILTKYIWFLIFELAVVQPDRSRGLLLLNYIPQDSLFYKSKEYLNKFLKSFFLPVLTYGSLSSNTNKLIIIFDRYYSYESNRSEIFKLLLNLMQSNMSLLSGGMDVIVSLFKKDIKEFDSIKESLLNLMKINFISDKKYGSKSAINFLKSAYKSKIITFDEIMSFLIIDAPLDKENHFSRSIEILKSVINEDLKYQQVKTVIDVLISYFKFLNNYTWDSTGVEEYRNKKEENLTTPLHNLLFEDHLKPLYKFSYREQELIEEMEKLCTIQNNKYINVVRHTINNFILGKREYLRKQKVRQQENEKKLQNSWTDKEEKERDFIED